MWFSPGEISKNKTEPLATFAIPAILDAENSKTDGKVAGIAAIARLSVQNLKCLNEDVEWVELPEQFTPGALIVTCYSPSGLVYEVEARNQEHADWLKRVNPPPKRRAKVAGLSL